MTDARITETTDGQGNIVERTVEQEFGSRNDGPSHVTVNTAPAQSSGGMGGIITVLLLLALVVGGYLIFANTSQEAAKDNAIADAASDVGAAAEKAGNAVEKAADKLAN